MPKKSALVGQIDQINRLVNRPWTELELAEKLERQNSLRLKYSGIERDRLQKNLDDAKAAGEVEKAAQLQDELDRLETPRLAFKTSLTPANKKQAEQSAALSQQERLAVINRENRRRNAEAVRQAQLKDRARAKESEARSQRGEASVANEDPRRPKNRAQSSQDANESNGSTKPTPSADSSRASTPAIGSNGAGPQKQGQYLLPHLAKLQQRSISKTGIPTIHKPLMDDDIIGSLDLEIDIEID